MVKETSIEDIHSFVTRSLIKMCKMKCVWVILACSIIMTTGLNEKQMEAAKKVVTNVCTQKTKATLEEIDKMHHGDWEIDHSAMCYMWCAFNMYKLMHKNNTLNYASATTQLNQLPESFYESAKMSIEKCKDEAYEIAKCMYFANPDKYFLP
ncbi:uncharacterized protein LOC114330732 isoform X2 [Diabrotica virgifera virgifera]|uniref:Uncharacterized protein LOC114330732 isoform X2 n=1 Tax=Diabrotica virgifera virgifera TaxID=50390 RepID=A0A6P7FSI0_DIAVI|nr:uncharacterized protein LOC114330732 isoform X2 [Diabrotica virgifera virgifera]